MFSNSLLTDCGQVIEDFPRGDATEPIWSGTVHKNGLNIFFSIMLLLWVDTCFLMTALDALGCKLFEL